MSYFNVSFNPRLAEIQKRISGYENYFYMILDRPGKLVPIFQQFDRYERWYGEASREKAWEVLQRWSIRVAWKMEKIVQENATYVIR